DFTGIGDNYGLYGGYNRSGDSMTWLPANFKAESSNGVAETTSDTLQMTITAQEGDWLTSVEIFEIGDYTMSGPSDGFAEVEVSATLFVNELAPSGGLAGYDSYSDTFNLNIDPSFDLFSGSLFVDLTGMNITSVRISWQNNLLASSESGTTGMIQKKYGELGISVDVIPEPATLGLLGIGGLMAVLRRRR
ncbi:MAG: PEP-CTERM sorting domain-containing protein, partial [Phycisphaerae bacterium]